MTKHYLFVLPMLLMLMGASVSGKLNAQNLKLHYGLSTDAVGSTTVIDESGGGNHGTLLNGAKISTYNGVPAIDLGTTSGYVDMGANTGQIIATLNDFTIVSKIFIPTTSTISANGNFVWTFANSNNIGSAANGCLFFGAKNGRYAISPTHYANESGIQTGTALTKGVWTTIAYVQKGGTGRLFIDGDLKVFGTIALNPSALGATAYNYLGRSCYSGDAYLNNAKLADFRIYDGAISTEQIEQLSGITRTVYDTQLLAQFNFDQLSDQSGSYTGSLANSAALIDCDGNPVLNLGDADGYFNLGAAFGNIVATLDSFTISTNLYIPQTTGLTGNGNFVWTFANSANMGSTANGNLFFSAITSRYAISKTNYAAESGIALSKALPKGEWINLTYSQTKGIGRIYINGMMMADNAISIIPSALGATTNNFLGRSCYSGDAYLKNAQYHKFRVYKGAMGETAIGALCNDLAPLNNYLDKLKVADAATQVTIDNADAVRSDLVLVSGAGDGIAVTWKSSNTTVVTNSGIVTRPAFGQAPIKVTMTATLSYKGISLGKAIEVTVLPMSDDQTSVALDLASLAVGGNIHNLRSEATLPITTLEGSKVEWLSDSPDYINNVGKVLKLSPIGSGKKTVVLTATVSKGNVSATKTFEVQVAEDDGTNAYLFVYFTGNAQANEQIRFALSNDGYNYTPLNNGNPVISSDTIAIKKAVRDPHILRGHDGKTFYMVLTDMKSSEGWSSNRGIVMMKSTDLVKWTHATVNFPTKWPAKWANVTRVWAPETIYDAQTGKYIVYFSLLTSDGTVAYDKVFYCYANDTFTDLEGEPTYLFDRGSATIDGNIVYNDVDNLYHLFFKNEGSGGICQVTSPTITAPVGQAAGSQWGTPTKTLQQTTEAVEGVGVFKLINSDNWVMMYDCYTNGHYQYCISPNLNDFKYVQDNYSISARHGTTMAITAEEAQRLVAKFPSSSLSNVPLGARNSNIRQNEIKINTTTKTIKIPIYFGADLTSFDPLLYASPGTLITPVGNQNFASGPVAYSFSINGNTAVYEVSVAIEANPIIPGFHADPEVLYSEKTGRFYVYPTTDGFAGWGGYSFDVFSSPNLVNWTNEGTIIDMSTGQVPWATGNAWAPCIIEKKTTNNMYRYYFYFSGESGGKKIGVAVANDPTGPFVDMGSPLVSSLPAGVGGGQQIDVDVFNDPQTGKSYLYWGNGYMAVAELNDDMVSIKEGTTQVLTPSGGTLGTYAYREAPYVFYRDGLYYFLWSVDDTGSANYHVAYGTSSSPTGPITVAAQPIVIIQDAANEIYGTAHNSIVKVPGKDEWYIVYHRINRNYISNDPGVHREVCIDRLNFNTDGTIQQVTPTRRGIDPVVLPNTSTAIDNVIQNDEKMRGKVVNYQVFNLSGLMIGADTTSIKRGIYLIRNIYTDGSVNVEKRFIR
jgi:arabinoxylan arabinofuranohydrolase